MPFAPHRPSSGAGRHLRGAGRGLAATAGVSASMALVPVLLLASPAVGQRPGYVAAEPLPVSTVVPSPGVTMPPYVESDEQVGGGVAVPGSVPVVTVLPPSRTSDLLGWPVPSHEVTSPFGMRVDPINGTVLLHTGTDFASPCGTPVSVADDGVVKAAGVAGDYGNRVVVKHADRDGRSFETAYNHMAEIKVTVGQQLKRGDIVGLEGTTGHSTGCHMHFEVIVGGAYTDPMPYLTGQPSTATMTVPVGAYMPSNGSTPTTRSAPPPSSAPTTRAPEPAPTRPSSVASSGGPTSQAPVPHPSSTAPSTAPSSTDKPSAPSSDSTQPSQPPESTAPVNAVVLFADTNGDGLWQSAEKQVAKPVALLLTPKNGGTPLKVVTTASGSFPLAGIADGSYVVTLDPSVAGGYKAITPPGATITVKNGASTDAALGVK